MLFEEFAPPEQTFKAKTARVVGVPLAFSIHSLWPFYSWFFHTLGVKVEISTQIVPEGVAKQESNYCFPAEIAHGAIQDVLDKGVDRIFLRRVGGGYIFVVSEQPVPGAFKIKIR